MININTKKAARKVKFLCDSIRHNHKPSKKRKLDDIILKDEIRSEKIINVIEIKVNVMDFDADKSLDIAQFLNLKENICLSMPFGSLGKHDVRDLFLHPDGYTVINGWLLH